MEYILEYEDFYDINDDINELNLIIENGDVSYDDILNFLKEDCGFDDEELNIYLSLNEGFWNKLKSGTSKLKTKASNFKAKAIDFKDRASDKYQRARDLGSRVKDHVSRNKGKYILGAAALASGVGIAGAGLALGAGHLADRHSN